MKMCTVCKQEKELDAFSIRSGVKSGRQSSCKECQSKKHEETKAARKEIIQASREKEYARRREDENYRRLLKSKRYLRRYGLSIDDYENMAAKQDYKCAICKLKVVIPDILVVDHCHVSNKVRKLLCDACNKGLGSFRDNPQTLREAASYIEQHQLG